MNRNMAIAFIVLLIVLGGGSWLLASHKSSQTNSSSTATTTKPTRTATGDASSDYRAGDGVSTANEVSLKGMAFSPAAITVPKGTTVTWTNDDSVTHTVTESDGQTGPKSGNLAPGQTYTYSFATTGTYKYRCDIHPDMTGEVIVTQ